LPRLRGVIGDTLALAPGTSAVKDEKEIQRLYEDAIQLLAEILQVANDAQIEGRNCTVDSNAIVDAAGILCHLSNRLASISMGRVVVPMPALDPDTESAREATMVAIRRQLQSWLDFFGGNKSLDARAAQAIARSYSPEDVRKPLAQLASRLEAEEFVRLQHWALDQRLTMLAELQSLRNLEVLIAELNQSFAQIPGLPKRARAPMGILRNSESGI
jgi:hypothetical protein